MHTWTVARADIKTELGHSLQLLPRKPALGGDKAQPKQPTHAGQTCRKSDWKQ